MLGIIVPYRDRPSHLKAFVPHLVAYFQQDKLDRELPYRVLVIEQGNRAPFNRGLLNNVGAALATDCDTLCFHDVDYLPIWADYRPASVPTRIIWHGAHEVKAGPKSKVLIRHDHATFFGAVVMTPRKHFESVNGFPNCYWGWGFEDQELRLRLLARNVTPALRDGTFEALPHESPGFDATTGRLTPAAQRNQKLFESRKSHLDSAHASEWDGLSSIDFTIQRRYPIKPAEPSGRGLFEMVTVDFPFPGNPDAPASRPKISFAAVAEPTGPLPGPAGKERARETRTRKATSKQARTTKSEGATRMGKRKK